MKKLPHEKKQVQPNSPSSPPLKKNSIRLHRPSSLHVTAASCNFSQLAPSHFLFAAPLAAMNLSNKDIAMYSVSSRSMCTSWHRMTNAASFTLSANRVSDRRST